MRSDFTSETSRVDTPRGGRHVAILAIVAAYRRTDGSIPGVDDRSGAKPAGPV